MKCNTPPLSNQKIQKMNSSVYLKSDKDSNNIKHVWMFETAISDIYSLMMTVGLQFECTRIFKCIILTYKII